MTRDELNRKRMMFQIYANRNKMPQIQKNANEEPVAHSATNDFLEYRKKVAAGVRMQKENNKSNLFNVTAANEQYRQDLMDQNIIIHAGITNQYIAKLDDFYGKGKPRYFYDQAEWDAYRRNMQGAKQSGADRGAKEGADAKNKNLANKAQEAFTKTTADYKNKELANKAQEAFTKSSADYKNKELADKAQEAFTKSTADYKNKDLANKAQEAFNNSPAANTEFRTTTDAYKNKDLLESNQKSKENAIKKSDPEYQKELEKASNIKADKERWGAYTTKEISSLVNNDKRFNNIKTADDAVNYPGGVEKLYKDIEAALEEKYPGKKKNYEASKNAGADRGAKESKVANEQKADKINKKNWEHNAKQNGINKIEEDGTVWVNHENAGKDRAMKERINNITDPDDPYLDKLAKGFDSYGWDAKKKQIELKMNRQDKNGVKYEKKTYGNKTAKHDGLEDGITTSEELTPEQEYLNFRAKVEAGLKHFGMTRGLMTVPVNQGLKNGESLAHAGYKPAGTHEYVAKIDLGNGKTRYFYTKEEWDAYNKNAGYAQNAEKDKNKKMVYNTNKENIYQKNADYAQNAGADRAKQIKMVQQQETSKKEMDDMFKKSAKINNDTGIGDVLGLESSYGHNAYSKALADINGYTVDDLKKNPGLRSKLMDEADKNPEKTIELSKSMSKNFEEMVTKDAKNIMDSLQYVKDFYHKGNATGKGNTYNTGINKDGLEVAKDIEDKYKDAMNKNPDNKLNGYIDFLSSLTKDEKTVVNMSYDFYKNNHLPANLYNAKDAGRELSEKHGQMSTQQQTEKYKYSKD